MHSYLKIITFRNRSRLLSPFFMGCFMAALAWSIYENFQLSESSLNPANYRSFSHSEVSGRALEDFDNAIPNNNSNVVDTGTSTKNITIPVFYNLFVKEAEDLPRVKGIVAEQFGELLPFHQPVYVLSIGVPLDFNEHDTEHNDPPLNTTRNPVELLGHYETATESVTLKAIWDYCNTPENNNQKVAYLHSKGSFTATPENEMLRRFLTPSILSQECSDMPEDTCNICTGRFSPVPHPHNPGNMWLARCDYIKKLIDPEKFQDAMDGLNYKVHENFFPCHGLGRYSAEHWVNSHPHAKPCDLYISNKYTWNYHGVPATQEFLENKSLKAAPRFKLETYIKKDCCYGYGSSKKWRIEEYRSLYNDEPYSDWWGHDFYETTKTSTP